MNHLAHLVLAGNEPAMLLGAILGDHVKGRLKGEFNKEVERGIRLHRAIDAFTDHHPDVKKSQRQFNPHFRRYSGIMLDVFFDYLLARSWQTYYESDLNEFSSDVLTTLIKQADQLPARAMQQVQRMHAMNSLASHGEDRYLEGAFSHLATRLKRDNPLTEAFDECQQNYAALDTVFRAFYPKLQSFAEDWKQQH